jgi:cytochrome P450
MSSRSKRSHSILFYGDSAKTTLSVANPSHTLFVAQLFQIPIKDSRNFLVGTSTKDLYLGLSIVFAYVFLDGDPAKSFKLRANAMTAQQKLSKLVRRVVEAVAFGEHLHLNRIFDRGSSGKLLSDYGNHLIERLIHRGQKVDDVVAEIIPTAAAAVATQAQAMTHMLDVYLQEEHMHHWADIRRCAYSDDRADFERLQKYALEACRLAPAAFGVLRNAAEGGTIRDGETTIKYEKGDLLYTDFVSAGRDKTIFSMNADQVDVDTNRDPSQYIHQGMGPHACLGRRITDLSLAVQLGLFAKLKNLRRVSGRAGQLKYTTDTPGGNLGEIRLYMTEDYSSWWPFPTSKFCRPQFRSVGVSSADVSCCSHESRT